MFNILLECCICWTYTLSNTVNTHNDTYTALLQTQSNIHHYHKHSLSLSPSLTYTHAHTHTHTHTCPHDVLHVTHKLSLSHTQSQQYQCSQGWIRKPTPSLSGSIMRVPTLERMSRMTSGGPILPLVAGSGGCAGTEALLSATQSSIFPSR